MANLFERGDPWPGAAGCVRRSLSQLELEHTSLEILRLAAKKLKVKILSPFWANPEKGHPGIVAHMAFPDKKIVIMTQHVRDMKRQAQFRAAWEGRGWAPYIILRGAIEQAPPDKLASDLAEILGIKRAKK